MSWEDAVKHINLIKNPLVFFGLYTIVVCIEFNIAMNATYDSNVKIWIVTFVGLIMSAILMIYSIITIKYPKKWYELKNKIDGFDQTTKFVESEGLIDFIRKTVKELSHEDRENE